ncbi:hypothetical protein CJF31_00006996 [Rutstroemia sp. NJR-2017a BVV2]|nr:hypothetical protein CJF31_00006996 [Rutstroemia sp. NJR-2017a BVV2]
MSSPPQFTHPPPPTTSTLLTFPHPSILLLTINRPQSLNCLDGPTHQELDSLFRWYDAEPTLLCAVLTGAGRAFCAGADLKEWDARNQTGKSKDWMPTAGFGGLSRREGKKPVVCAVNGICFGGGCEMVVNADLVVAEEGAGFALPEVKIGVVAVAGALTRLVRTVGRQRAMEMALTGRRVDAHEAEKWGLVNKVVPKGKAVEAALELAEMIVANSPDSVIVSRKGVNLGWDGVGAEEGTRILEEGLYARMDAGENMKEGVRSFVEKRKPRWVGSKL